MAKRKSLMDALAEYQDKNEFGRAQRKEEREKKMSRNASKAKTNTQKAFSTKQLLKTDNVKTNKKQTRRGAGERTPLSGGAGGTRPTRGNSGGGSSSSSTRSNSSSSGSSSSTRKPESTSTSSTSSRVSKFLGGQTIEELQAWAKKQEEKKKNSPHGRQQAELDRLRAAQAEERKKRTTKGRSSWAKGQLKGL